jgi:hypothetical protein
MSALLTRIQCYLHFASVEPSQWRQDIIYSHVGHEASLHFFFANQSPAKLSQTSGQVLMFHSAGFGTLDPAQGLAVLAAALDAASCFPPAVAASPLLWGALLKPGAPRRHNAAYSEVALPPAEPQHAQPSQQELRLSTQQRGGAATAAAPGSGEPGSRKQREADLRARLLGEARGVIGADITADQPLMEVSCTSCSMGGFCGAWSSGTSVCSSCAMFCANYRHTSRASARVRL